MLTKKVITFASGLIVAVFLILDSIGTFRLCGGKVYGSCMESLHSSLGIFLPVFPFFIFAVIAYFLREEVYKTWVRVALVWLAISMILIAITPDITPGGFGPQISFGKSDVALLTSGASVIISIVTIAWKYFSPRKR